jgi:hypothetical protein
VISDQVLDNILRERSKVRAIFDSPTVPEAHRNTAYGLVQAGIEYLDHLPKSELDDRLDIPFDPSLRAIVVGEAFPAKSVPDLRTLLAGYRDVDNSALLVDQRCTVARTLELASPLHPASFDPYEGQKAASQVLLTRPASEMEVLRGCGTQQTRRGRQG